MPFCSWIQHANHCTIECLQCLLWSCEAIHRHFYVTLISLNDRNLAGHWKVERCIWSQQLCALRRCMDRQTAGFILTSSTLALWRSAAMFSFARIGRHATCRIRDSQLWMDSSTLLWNWLDRYALHAHFHKHTHTFNGRLSRTTRVSQYQKGKTNLDFTEARDSEWQWRQLDGMQVCTSLQTDSHSSTPPLSFLQAECPSCCLTNSIKALKALHPSTYSRTIIK